MFWQNVCISLFICRNKALQDKSFEHTLIYFINKNMQTVYSILTVNPVYDSSHLLSLSVSLPPPLAHAHKTPPLHCLAAIGSTLVLLLLSSFSKPKPTLHTRLRLKMVAWLVSLLLFYIIQSENEKREDISVSLSQQSRISRSQNTLRSFFITCMWVVYNWGKCRP